MNPPLSFVLFTALDGTWKRIRTIVTPTFTAAKLREINPIVVDCLEVLQKKMQVYSETGEDVNITRLFALFALDVIMKAAFGYDIDVQNQPNDEFLSMTRKNIRVPLWKRAFSAFPFSDQLCDIFNIQIFSNADYFLDIAHTMIVKRKDQAGPAHARRDVLQLMLEAHDNEVDGKPKLSDDEIAAQCFVFLIAGFETTSTTLTSAAYLLAKHPDIQETFQQELDKATDENKDSSPYDLVHHIEYLDKVVCEVLRLYGPGFNLIRVCNEDVVIKVDLEHKATVIMLPKNDVILKIRKR
ncbi:cytochrome P450 3A2 [Exaiptasia diaphana]|uniref:Cytochrome P450 n=1 Tax=Exaiptasia diaphana TaxID=2652724 RepID=A0A913YNF3_EXADI|nr:cytochrome P450 3A2 [Exaiptasia diaphana]